MITPGSQTSLDGRGGEAGTTSQIQVGSSRIEEDLGGRGDGHFRGPARIHLIGRCEGKCAAHSRLTPLLTE